MPPTRPPHCPGLSAERAIWAHNLQFGQWPDSGEYLQYPGQEQWRLGLCRVVSATCTGGTLQAYGYTCTRWNAGETNVRYCRECVQQFRYDEFNRLTARTVTRARCRTSPIPTIATATVGTERSPRRSYTQHQLQSGKQHHQLIRLCQRCPWQHRQ